MFYGHSVKDTRQLFYSSWSKHRAKQPLLPIERQIVQVIMDHPEYQPMLEKGNPEHETPFFPELGQTNPFLHMGLHLAIRDQVSTDRPAGIQSLYQTLVGLYASPLELEHRLMDFLAETLWIAQRDGAPPNEAAYLKRCQELLSI